MTMATMTVRGQITIPKNIRELLQLKPGDRVDFVVQEDNKVLVQPATIDVADLRGILFRPGQPVLSVEEMDEAIAQAACASMDNTK